MHKVFSSTSQKSLNWAQVWTEIDAPMIPGRVFLRGRRTNKKLYQLNNFVAEAVTHAVVIRWNLPICLVKSRWYFWPGHVCLYVSIHIHIDVYTVRCL